MTQRIRVGLVGFGYWGPNLLRNLFANEDCEAVGIVEFNPAAIAKAKKLYPQLTVFTDLSEMLQKTRPEAMVVATPPITHCEIGLKCLQAGAHVLMEKPLAMSERECEILLDAALKNQRTLMVDHTFVYNPAVEYLGESVQKNRLGSLLYYDSTRINLGGFQPGANVLWDLAPHDFSILDYLTGGKEPEKISVLGVKHFNSDVENLCYVTLLYPDNFIAHLHLNWAAPVKVRTVLVGGSEKMAIYDDNMPTEKIRIYDRGVSLTKPSDARADDTFRVNYRVGDMLAPAISNREALSSLVSDFVRAIRTGERPRSGADSGLRIVRLLEKGSLSLKQGGALIGVSK